MRDRSPYPVQLNSKTLKSARFTLPSPFTSAAWPWELKWKRNTEKSTRFTLLSPFKSERVSAPAAGSLPMPNLIGFESVLVPPSARNARARASYRSATNPAVPIERFHVPFADAFTFLVVISPEEGGVFVLRYTSSVTIDRGAAWPSKTAFAPGLTLGARAATVGEMKIPEMVFCVTFTAVIVVVCGDDLLPRKSVAYIEKVYTPWVRFRTVVSKNPSESANVRFSSLPSFNTTTSEPPYAWPRRETLAFPSGAGNGVPPPPPPPPPPDPDPVPPPAPPSPGGGGGGSAAAIENE